MASRIKEEPGPVLKARVATPSRYLLRAKSRSSESSRGGGSGGKEGGAVVGSREKWGGAEQRVMQRWGEMEATGEGNGSGRRTLWGGLDGRVDVEVCGSRGLCLLCVVNIDTHQSLSLPSIRHMTN